MTDKLIVFFTNIKNQFVDNSNDEFSYTLRNVSVHNAAKGDSVAISAYFVDGDGDPFQNEKRLDQLVDQNIVRQMGMHCLYGYLVQLATCMNLTESCAPLIRHLNYCMLRGLKSVW